VKLNPQTPKARIQSLLAMLDTGAPGECATHIDLVVARSPAMAPELSAGPAGSIAMDCAASRLALAGEGEDWLQG